MHDPDLHYGACFAISVEASIDVTGLSMKQVAAIETIIERRSWVEPPRFLRLAEVVADRPCGIGHDRGDVYVVTICPGAPTDGIRPLLLAKPASL